MLCSPCSVHYELSKEAWVVCRHSLSSIEGHSSMSAFKFPSIQPGLRAMCLEDGVGGDKVLRPLCV